MSIGAIAQPRRLAELVRELLLGKDDRAHARRGAVFAFSIRVVSAALAYISQVLLARWMGAEEYGIFAYCWVWLTILGILTPIGLNTSVLRFLPQYEKRGELGLYHGLLRGSRTIAGVNATIFAFAGAAIVWITDGIIDPAYS
ncbi:MAG: oligosaccharide flippase family protein, partial [Rhizobiales bacterium]|nr:oligosaccharide flippase family protein [Hyphomicrobiales bacterium]